MKHIDRLCMERAWKTAVVVGYMGEVGSSLFEVFDNSPLNVVGYDLGDEDLAHSSVHHSAVMHVAIPYSDTFVTTVVDWMTFVEPVATVIHSTVPVGTTWEIGIRILEADSMGIQDGTIRHPIMYHSPVMGRHPNLAGSLTTFEKIIGPGINPTPDSIDPRPDKFIEQHFLAAGMRPVFYKTATATELAKLASTTFYGLTIAYAQEVSRWCEEHKVSFQEVMDNTTRIYNEGYQALGCSRFTRPRLHPGYIGGHCVMPNLDLLDQVALERGLKPSELVDLIRKSNEQHAVDHPEEVDV